MFYNMFYNMFYFTFSDPQNLRVTVNHSLSLTETCNQQCIGGCNGTSHLNCFACRRVMDQLSDGRKNCIEQCPDGLLLVGKFCFTKYFFCQFTKFTHKSVGVLLHQLWIVNYYVKCSSNNLSNDNKNTGGSREMILQK